MTEINRETDFKIKELCWAKLKGYPWWPAIIRDIPNSSKEKTYLVGYLCEKKGSKLKVTNLKKWKDNYAQFKDGGFKKSKNGKVSKCRNDFLCALKFGEMYSEGKIDLDGHDNFINEYVNNKDSHSLEKIEMFFNNYIKEKQEKKTKKENISEDKDKDRLIGKKRNISKVKDKEKVNENIEQKKIIKDNEINMKQKEIDKMDDLINNITYNMDEILIKSEKYQKFFSKECKEKHISINDNKNIKTKIELIKYLQIMIESLNVPINLNNYIQNMNTKK